MTMSPADRAAAKAQRIADRQMAYANTAAESQQDRVAARTAGRADDKATRIADRQAATDAANEQHQKDKKEAASIAASEAWWERQKTAMKNQAQYAASGEYKKAVAYARQIHATNITNALNDVREAARLALEREFAEPARTKAAKDKSDWLAANPPPWTPLGWLGVEPSEYQKEQYRNQKEQAFDAITQECSQTIIEKTTGQAVRDRRKQEAETLIADADFALDNAIRSADADFQAVMADINDGQGSPWDNQYAP